ncbi:MAG: PilZ domain-containing protein [Desulfosarcinaceae bacterium]|nr:PilZ domain-containing protein [Desulfosarcinaceae bacterium]
MRYSDKIEGDAVVDVIAALIEDHTMVRIKFALSEAERICIINSQRTISNLAYFQIDMPTDVPHPEDAEEWQVEMLFDFMGRDRLNYSFTASGGIMMGDKLWVKLPAHIERIQQRSNFRIDTPKRSLLELTVAEQTYTLILENISLGGAFCRAKRSLKTGVVRVPVQTENIIEDLRLEIPADDGPAEVSIRRSRIARVVKDPDKRLRAYGIEFLEIGRHEKARLTRIIYDLQRRFLKHRLK